MKVVISEEGYGEFHCNETSVSIYVREGAEGRELFGTLLDLRIFNANRVVRMRSRFRSRHGPLFAPNYVACFSDLFHLLMMKDVTSFSQVEFGELKPG